MFDRILVPMDQSPCAQAALLAALHIAKANSSALTICHVVDSTAAGALVVDASTLPSTDLELAEAAGATLLGEAEHRANAMGVAVKTVLRHGEPVTEITRCAKEIDATAIFMGTHGLGGLARLLLGSVTQAVMRAANVPVITLRDDRKPSKGEAPAFTHILVAYDGSEEASRALDVAREMYGAYGGELSICYVSDPTRTLSVVGSPSPGSNAVIEGIRAQGRAALEIAAGRMNGAHVNTFLRSGHPCDEILACAEETHADLIMVGSRGHGLMHVILGSVSEAIMKRATLPVAVVGGKAKKASVRSAGFGSIGLLESSRLESSNAPQA